MRLRVPGLPSVLLRAAPREITALALLVALAAAALVTVPAWFDAATGAALPQVLASAGPGRTGLEYTMGSLLGVEGTDPLNRLTETAAALEAELPPSLAAVTGPATGSIETAEYLAIDAPVPVSRLALRIVPDATTMTRIVEGREPSEHVGRRQLGQLENNQGEPLMVASVEVAVSRETATELQLVPGTVLALMPGQNKAGIGIAVVVSGIFEVVDPADPRWFGDTTLDSPVEVRASSEVTIYHAIGLLNPAISPDLVLLGASSPLLQYRWRFPVDTSGAAGWDADALLADLARLEARHPFRGALAVDVPGLSSGLTDLLVADAAQRSVASTAFGLAMTGGVVAALGILALAATALAERRRVTLLVLRARGSGAVRLLFAGVGADLPILVVAAGAGAGLAAALVGALGPRPVPSATIATVAAATALLALLAVAWGTVTVLRSPATSRPGASTRRTGSPARARVATSLVVVAALAAAFVLRTSGGASTAAADAIAGPSAAAVPLLLGLAGGLVLARAIGLAARLAAGVVPARTRGLGLAHALRGIAIGSGGRDLVLVIVVVAVGSGVLAATIAGSIARAEATAAAAEVGADYRIAALSPAGLPVTMDTAALEKIGPTAVVRTGSATISAQTLAGTFVTVATVDPAAYAAVTGGTLVDPALGDALAKAAALGTTAATDGAPRTVGLVASSGIARRLDLRPGTRVTVSVAGKPATGEVVAVLANLPGMPAGMDVVVPETQFAADATVPAEVLLRAGPDAAATVGAAVASFRSQVVVTSRQDAVDRRHEGVIPAAVRSGFTLAQLAAALLAGLAVLLVLATTESARRREALVLVLLGMPEAAARRLVVNQTILTVAIAATAGLALGAGVAWLTVPDLGLGRMADVTRPVAAVMDPSGLAVAVAGPLVAAVIGLGIVSLTGARGGRGGRGGGAGLTDEAARRLGHEG